MPIRTHGRLKPSKKSTILSQNRRGNAYPFCETTMARTDAAATRPSLLLRIRDASDSASWSDFVEVYGPIIRAYALRRGLQEADARDIEQDVLAQVARSIASFEYTPERGRFRDWLGTITRRRIGRFWRAQADTVRGAGGDSVDGRIVSIEAPGDDPEWTAAFHARVLETALDRVRPSFEPATWEAFVLVWAEERPAVEVAKSLGLAIDSVYAAKSRILKRLRDEVLALADDLPRALPPT